MTKFLIDAQIPRKLSEFLQWKGFDAIHTLDLPDKNRTTDAEINRISILQERVLISKDLDFIESIIISGKPYKLLYVATGNITNRELLKLFSDNLEEIVKCVEQGRLIELSIDKITVRF